MHYPEPMVSWLASILRAVDFHWNVLDILETDDRYPGLLDDLFEHIGWRNHAKYGEE